MGKHKKNKSRERSSERHRSQKDLINRIELLEKELNRAKHTDLPTRRHSSRSRSRVSSARSRSRESKRYGRRYRSEPDGSNPSQNNLGGHSPRGVSPKTHSLDGRSVASAIFYIVLESH